MSLFFRLLATGALLWLTAFCTFGFLASFELSSPLQRLPWQLGFGAFGIACILTAVSLFRRRPPTSPPSKAPLLADPN